MATDENMQLLQLEWYSSFYEYETFKSRASSTKIKISIKGCKFSP